jgi:hypothetical protein
VTLETDVARVALAALAPQWSEYWPEVPSHTGRIDAVGRDTGGELHAVECKRQPSLALAAQGALRISERAFATVLLVAGQTETRRRWGARTGIGDLIDLGQRVGFGVGAVRNDTFTLELPPRTLAVEPGAREIVARALNDIHRAVAGDAGGQSSAYWTEWKQGLHELEQAVLRKPGQTTSQLVIELRHIGRSPLYWQNHAAQIRALAEQSPRIRAEFHGREFRFFPVLQTSIPLET